MITKEIQIKEKNRFVSSCVECQTKLGDYEFEGFRQSKVMLTCMGCHTDWCQGCGTQKPADCVRPPPYPFERKKQLYDPTESIQWEVVCADCRTKPPTDKTCTRCGAFVYLTERTMCDHHDHSASFHKCLNGCYVEEPMNTWKKSINKIGLFRWVSDIVGL